MKIVWIILLFPLVGRAQTLSLVNSGSGISQTVSVTSSGQFEIVFEATDNWGLSQWYDLVNDPSATTNLALAYAVNGPSVPCARENGLAQMTLYGDNDAKISMFEAGCHYSGSTRSMTILASSPQEVIIKVSGYPMTSDPSIDTNLTGTTIYCIFPNGKIYIHQNITVVTPFDLTGGGTDENYLLEVGLNDPSGGSATTTTSGWIRASTTQNPYTGVSGVENYVFAYWNSSDPNYPNFTKASIELVNSPNNPTGLPQGQILHGWSCGTGCGTQRWGYASSASSSALNLGNGGSVSWDWLLQLGTQGSSFLPNLTSSTTAGPIAAAYRANPNPPGVLQAEFGGAVEFGGTAGIQ